jgi:flagellar hook assembly protein FlgD
LPNTYFYQITALYDFGESPPTNEVSVVVTSVADNTSSLPTEYALNQNYPNPFNPSTVIEYAIPTFHNSQNVKLEIYNTLGQKVRTLVDKEQTAGRYQVEWDGKNDIGKPVTSGLYVYRIKAGIFSEVKKCFLSSKCIVIAI